GAGRCSTPTVKGGAKGDPGWLHRVQKQKGSPAAGRPMKFHPARPSNRCTAKQGDELAPSHSITSSAVASRFSGTSMPSALAVLRLITSSNFVGCSTGISAGFTPFKILSTNSAARRYCCRRSVPYDRSPPSTTKSRLVIALESATNFDVRVVELDREDRRRRDDRVVSSQRL